MAGRVLCGGHRDQFLRLRQHASSQQYGRWHRNLFRNSQLPYRWHIGAVAGFRHYRWHQAHCGGGVYLSAANGHTLRPRRYRGFNHPLR